VRERDVEEKFQRQKVLGEKDRPKVLKIDDEGKRKKRNIETFLTSTVKLFTSKAW
jgi:hypothetical protein